MRTNIFWSRCRALLHWIEVPRPLLLLFVRNSSREHESSRGGYIRVALLLWWVVAEAGRKGRKTKRWKHNINKNQTSYYLETVRARSGFPLNIFIQHESFRNHSEMWKVKDSLPAFLDILQRQCAKEICKNVAVLADLLRTFCVDSNDFSASQSHGSHGLSKRRCQKTARHLLEHIKPYVSFQGLKFSIVSNNVHHLDH